MSTNLNTGEGNIFAVLADDERASRMFVVQHCSELEDLQILVPSVLYGGDDPQIRYERDFVRRGRKRNLKTNGASFVLSISTYGHKAENKEGQKEHGEVEKSKGDWIEAQGVSAPHPHLYTS